MLFVYINVMQMIISMIERENMKLVQSEAFEPVLATTDENLENELLIPRRPDWEHNTAAEELRQMENESYLKWRRKLTQLQERDDTRAQLLWNVLVEDKVKDIIK